MPENYNGSAPSVINGCKVPSIELHVRAINGNGVAAIQNNQILVIYKQEAGQADILPADLQALDGFAQKRMILHMDQLNTQSGGPAMEWHIRLKLPRGVHRFYTNTGGAGASDDKLRLAVMNNDPTLGNMQVCGFAIYKWYK